MQNEIEQACQATIVTWAAITSNANPTDALCRQVDILACRNDAFATFMQG